MIVDLAGHGGLPTAGMAAVVLNLTATDASGPGFVTAWADGPRPATSNLNVEESGQTVPNLVVVPVDGQGRVRLGVQTATHLVADVAGWFTDASAAPSTDGLFVALTPARILDSRTEAATGGVFGAASLAGGTAVDLAVAGRGGVPATGVGAVVANVTATGTTAPGFVTVHPAGTLAPLASNLNVEGPDQTVANLVAARLGHGGRVSLLAQEPLDLVVDLAGWFTGTAA